MAFKWSEVYCDNDGCGWKGTEEDLIESTECPNCGLDDQMHFTSDDEPLPVRKAEF